MSCSISESIKYCLIDNILVVGTNSSEDALEPKAVSSYSAISGHIAIPSRVSYFEGFTVQEIGCSAFSRCFLIVSVSLPPTVTKLFFRSFVDCYSLESINIPSSVEFIGTGAISSYNISNPDNRISHGLLTVFFDPKSKIQNIGASNFGYKEIVHIYIWESASISCGPQVFLNSNEVRVFSPKIFSFCGKITECSGCDITSLCIYPSFFSLITIYILLFSFINE